MRISKKILATTLAACLFTGSMSGQTVFASEVQSSNTAILQADEETQVVVADTNVKKTKLVADGKIRIDWSKSAGADGYTLYRRTHVSDKWEKCETVKGESQTYCYDKIKKGKTYYYAVKAYKTVESAKQYSNISGNGFKVKYSSTTLKKEKMDYSKNTVYGPNMTSKQRKQLKKAVNKFCKNMITSDMSKLERIIVIHAYLLTTNEYADWKKHSANTAWSALCYWGNSDYGDYKIHSAACSGYARAMKALCDAADVPCRYVHANKSSSVPDHQWCEVKIDGKWYIVDPQAADDEMFVDGGGFDYFAGTYLLIGSKNYKKCGLRWDTKKYPKVNKSDYSKKKKKAAYNGYKVQTAFDNILYEYDD